MDSAEWPAEGPLFRGIISNIWHTIKCRINERDGVSNHQPHDCLLSRLLRRRSKKTSKLRVTGLCEGNSPVTGGFPAQRASNAEHVSICWRHHDILARVLRRFMICFLAVTALLSSNRKTFYYGQKNGRYMPRCVPDNLRIDLINITLCISRWHHR